MTVVPTFPMSMWLQTVGLPAYGRCSYQLRVPACLMDYLPVKMPLQRLHSPTASLMHQILSDAQKMMILSLAAMVSAVAEFLLQI